MYAELFYKLQKIFEVDSSKNKKIVFLAGLPGSGKTELSYFFMKNDSNRKYVIIDLDDYRKYHPKASFFLEKGPLLIQTILLLT